MLLKSTPHPTYEPGASQMNQSALSINTKIPMVEDLSRTPSPTEAEFNYLHDIKKQNTIWK
jgi:hypothetical protein